MAAKNQGREGVETGRILEDTLTPRRAQSLGDTLYANLTSRGVREFGLEKGAALNVVVCERGIWIEPAEAE